MALGWKPPWAGNNFRLEAALAWKQLQAGSNRDTLSFFYLAFLNPGTFLGSKHLSAGNGLGLETALGWKKPQAGSSLGLEAPDLEGPVLDLKCTFEISWSQ